METLLKTTTTLLPYHLLSYGTLLGTELYQVSLLSTTPQHLQTNRPTNTPELHKHKALLPNPPTTRIPHPPKTPLPHLLRLPGWPRRPHSRHAPAVRGDFVGRGCLGRGTDYCCCGDGVSELGLFWADDGDGFVGSVGFER